MTVYYIVDAQVMQHLSENVPFAEVVGKDQFVEITDGSNEAVNISLSSSGNATAGSGSTEEVTSSPNVVVNKATTPTSIVSLPMSSGNVAGNFIIQIKILVALSICATVHLEKYMVLFVVCE